MKPFNVFPYDSNIDFMRMRWVSLSVAFLLMVVALGAMGARGFNFALDFTGGIGVELRYEKKPDVDKVREQLASAGFHGAQVQNFGSGDDLLVRLQADGKQEAGADKASSIGDAVAKVDGTVLIRGHTDNRPIRSARFPSNWHLSQARADAVAEALTPRLGSHPKVKTEGSADSEPVATNETPEGRAQNRRVEVIVFPAARGN